MLYISHKCFLTNTKLFHWSFCPCRVPQKAITYIPKAYMAILPSHSPNPGIIFQFYQNQVSYPWTDRQTSTTISHGETVQVKGIFLPHNENLSGFCRQFLHAFLNAFKKEYHSYQVSISSSKPIAKLLHQLCHSLRKLEPRELKFNKVICKQKHV